MWQFLLSVSRWFRQNTIALVRMMLSLLCIGLVIAKVVMLSEVDFVSVSLLLLAALSFRPTMLEAIPRYVRHLRMGGMDVDLHDPDSARIQQKFEAAQEKPVPSSEPMPPPSAESIVGEISEIVRTKKIVLHDGNTNEERARLFVAGNGAVNLQLFDSAGEERAAMWVSEDGEGRIKLADNNGIVRLLLSGDDVPLIFRDSKDGARGGLLVGDDNETYFALLNEDGQINCTLKASKDGGMIRVNSTDEKNGAGLAAANGIPGALYLANKSTGESTVLLAGRAAKIEKGDSSG